jgi:hypothetical protein
MLVVDTLNNFYGEFYFTEPRKQSFIYFYYYDGMNYAKRNTHNYSSKKRPLDPENCCSKTL